MSRLKKLIQRSNDIFDYHLENKAVAKKDLVLAGMLEKAYDRCEGMYSKIPECCIDAYLGGLRAKYYLDNQDPKVRKKIGGWGYVPCEECFKNDKKVKIKRNGVSFQGLLIKELVKFFKGQRR